MIRLPADLYDALELAAEVFGGVGAGNDFRDGEPWCIHALALFLDPSGALSSLLYRHGVRRTGSDVAVHDVTGNVWWSTRIPFQEWAQAAGVVRDEEGA